MKNQTPIGAHKAVPREDFKYKNEWRKAQEKEREEDNGPSEASCMLATAACMIFVKFLFMALPLNVPDATEQINAVLPPAIGFLVSALINMLGKKLESYKKTRKQGIGITILAHAIFSISVYFLMANGGN